MTAGMIFCRGCGKEILETAVSCPHCGAPQLAHAASSSNTSMTFGDAVSICLSKYADFNGRASRAEYWWFYLFLCLVGFVAGIIEGMAKMPASLSLIMNIAFMLPSIAAAVRRLHDVNRSGWALLWCFTIIGIIPVFIWHVTKGDAQENRYGPSPL